VARLAETPVHLCPCWPFGTVNLATCFEAGLYQPSYFHTDAQGRVVVERMRLGSLISQFHASRHASIMESKAEQAKRDR